MSLDLRKLVTDIIANIGRAESATKFGVSRQTIANWEAGGAPSVEAVQIALNEWYANGGGAIAQAASWEGRKVFFLLAAYEHMCLDTHDSLFRNYARYGPEKIGILMEKGTLIEDARNTLCTRFMKEKESEYAIMIDVDMVLPVGDSAVTNNTYRIPIPAPFSSYLFIDRILSHNKPLVGGLYFGRHSGGKAQYAEAFESDIEDQNAHRLIRPGLKATRWVATGAMCVHRSVFQAIQDAAPEKFPDIIPQRPDQPWAYFRRLGPQIGEDVSFCMRATACGIQPYVDTGLICGHVGLTNFGPTNTMDRFTRGK
jgi:transcriptional regulator with XRE-family HTH domain